MSTYQTFYTSRKEWVLDRESIQVEGADYYFIPEVFDVFENEYYISTKLYKRFIEDKDLGLVTNVTKDNEATYGREIRSDYYMVVDEKKWMLAKIKYGI
jgi:hypothetical protein